MSVNNARRTQNVSRCTFSSVVGTSLEGDFFPQTVSEPSCSRTSKWPISICCRRDRTALRDRVTRGPQATDPTCARTKSSALVMKEAIPTRNRYCWRTSRTQTPLRLVNGERKKETKGASEEVGEGSKKYLELPNDVKVLGRSRTRCAGGQNEPYAVETPFKLRLSRSRLPCLLGSYDFTGSCKAGVPSVWNLSQALPGGTLKWCYQKSYRCQEATSDPYLSIVASKTK
jgi:hypothetical protein